MTAAVDAAWQRAIEASETQGQRQRADADRIASSSQWAAPPALLFGYRDDRWQSNFGNREAEIAVAWPLWLPGQREARGAASESAIELARLARLAARLRVAGEVREAAWTLTKLQAERAQAEAQLRALRELANDVDRRVRAGDLARADALVARADLLSASAREAEARQRLLEAHGRWTVLTGLDALPGALEAAGEPAVGADIATHPELQLAAQATELARRRVEVARSSRRDPPEIAVGVRQEVPARGELTQNSIGIGLRLPFGTDDRNQPLQAAALSELDVAQAREQRLRARLDADVSAARAAQRSAERQLADHQARAALLRERAQLLDKAFRAGESPLPELLRALDAAAQGDGALVRQQAALGLARAHPTIPRTPAMRTPPLPRFQHALRRACLALIAALARSLALAAPGAHGPGGEHFDEVGRSAAGTALPRIVAKSELFELVAEVKGAELSVQGERAPG